MDIFPFREPRSFKDHVNVDSVCVTDSEEVPMIALPPELQGSAPTVSGPLMTSSQSMSSFFVMEFHATFTCN